MDYKKTNASRSTITRSIKDLDTNVGNIYETLAILEKRANQIGLEIKEELVAKLQEFATHTDSLEEVFENNEQIEVSKFYESLPKPTLIAIQEMLEEKIYHRKAEKKD